MPKLHGAECIRDEVVWFCHCVCYPDGWLMSVWEFVHVLYHYSCGLWSSVQKFVSGRYGRSGDVRLYCCVTCGWVWGQSIMLLCHRWCVLQFAALLHGFKSLPFCTIEIRESYLLLCLTWDVVEWCRVIILLFSSITELEALHSVVIVTSRIPTLPRTFCWEVEVYEQNWSLLEFRLTALVRSNARSMSAPIFAHIKTKP